MPAITTTVQLTNGVTTLTLNDQVNYFATPDVLALGMSQARDDVRANQPPYADVVTELRLLIRGGAGNTATQALANLHALIDLLDQADRWVRGDRVAPVRLRVLPVGSNAAAAWESLILGWSGAGFELPRTLLDTVGRVYIPDVTIRLLRRGQWLQPTTENGGGVDILVNHGATALWSFGSSVADAHWPLTLELYGIRRDVTYAPSYLLLANHAEKIAQIPATAMTPFGNWTSGIGTLAFSSTIKTVTLEPRQAASLTMTLPATLLPYAARLCVFAACQVGGGVFDVQLDASRYNWTADRVTLTLDHTLGSTDPGYYSFGSLHLPPDSVPNVLTLQIINSGTATATFSIDRLILLAADEYSRDLAIGRFYVTSIGTTLTSTLFVALDERSLTHRTPAARLYHDPNARTMIQALEVRGNAALTHAGSQLAALWLVAPEVIDDSRPWRVGTGAQGSSGQIDQYWLRALHRPASLLPR
jgi:hypothetical protein